MRKNIVWIFAVAVALPAVVSCDKLKTVANNLEKTGGSAPVVAGVYRSEQMSDIGKADHAGFIARKNAVVVVDFQAEWCGPCKILTPVLAKATEAHPGVVYVGKVDVDRAGDLAAEQMVKGIPDVRIYKDGREVERFVGFPGEKEVLDKIAGHTRGITPTLPAARAASEPTIKPSEKGWLPPGVSRKQQAAPQKP